MHSWRWRLMFIKLYRWGGIFKFFLKKNVRMKISKIKHKTGRLGISASGTWSNLIMLHFLQTVWEYMLNFLREVTSLVMPCLMLQLLFMALENSSLWTNMWLLDQWMHQLRQPKYDLLNTRSTFYDPLEWINRTWYSWIHLPCPKIGRNESMEQISQHTIKYELSSL